MTISSKTNHGEEDSESAKRFDATETRFVESAQDEKKVRDGASIRPEEDAHLVQAECLGRARAKGLDMNFPSDPYP